MHSAPPQTCSVSAALAVWLSVVVYASAGHALPAECQAAIDAECASDCFVHIKSRPCDGPMIARHDASSKMKGWKCYSPSTLDPATHTKYKKGSCYCSRDDQIKAVLANTPSCPTPVAPPTPAPPPVFAGAVPVFYPGLGGSKCFRIPTIVKTSRGTLLAFAEKRGDSCGDDGSHALVLRRSADDGKTWGPMLTVRQGTPPCSGCPAAISNPNPVEVELPSGRAVLLHFDTMNNPSASEHGLDEQIWSFDDGLTWTNNSVIAYPPIKNTGSLIGPSQGIQAADGTIYFVAHGGSSGNFLYWSKDYGKSWAPSQRFFGTGNECSIAFLESPKEGRIIMNCRTSEHKRGQLLWSANGTIIENMIYPAGLVDAGCQGSIVNVHGTLFTSNAASTKSRKNMMVKTSVDQGRSWKAAGPAVWAGPSGYSQLVDLARKGVIGLLFEAGKDKYTESISFVVVPV